MQWIRERFDELFTILLELAVGVLLLINAVSLTGTILSILGALMIVLSLSHIWKYFREEAPQAVQSQDFALGLLLLLAGLAGLFHRLWLAELLLLLPLLYGGLILVAGCAKAQRAMDRLRLRRPRAWVYGVCCLLTLVVGFLTIVQPFGNSIVHWTFVGIALIVLALADAAALILADWQSKKPLRSELPQASLGGEIGSPEPLKLSASEREVKEPQAWPQEGLQKSEQRK